MDILILDDEDVRHSEFAKRFREHNVFHTKDPWEAVCWMKERKFDLVSLDHDLNWFEFTPYKQEITGTEVARAMLALPGENRPGEIHIHSWNPDGARRMFLILKEAGFVHIIRNPFTAIKSI